NKAKDFLVSMLTSANPEEMGGKDVTLRDVVDQAAADVSSDLADEPEVEAFVRETLGRTYLGLGDTAKAAPHIEAAAGLMRSLKGEGTLDDAEGLRMLANLNRARGDWPKTIQYEQSAIEIRRRLIDGPHLLVAQSLYGLG